MYVSPVQNFSVDSIPRPSLYQEQRASQICEGTGSIESGPSGGPAVDWGTKGPGPVIASTSYGSHTTAASVPAIDWGTKGPGPTIAPISYGSQTTAGPIIAVPYGAQSTAGPSIGAPTMGPPTGPTISGSSMYPPAGPSMGGPSIPGPPRV